MDKSEHKIVLILDPKTPQSAIDKLHALKAEGYRVENTPADGESLMRALLAAEAEEMFQRGGYGIYFTTLPRALQDSVTECRGAPERDPTFRESRLDCGAFAMRAVRCGNVVVAIEPPRDQPPTHAYLAFYAWIADGIRAQAIVKLTNESAPETAVCALPRLA